MTRIFEGYVLGGVVYADGGVVPDCTILGEGGDSSGYLVMSEEELVFLPKTTPDVKALIELLETLCDKITALRVVSSMAGTQSSTPVNSAEFNEIKTSLTNLKTILK